MKNLNQVSGSAVVACASCLLLAALARADTNAPPTRLPRTNLLVYHNRKGEAAPVKTKADWQKRRAEILSSTEPIMGPLPGKERRCPLDVKVEQETDCGAYVRRLISYASE